MFELAAAHETIMTSLVVFVAAAFIGAMKRSKLQIIIFLILWFIPLIYTTLATVIDRRQIEYEFGDWWALLAISPFFLALWSVITLFPFKLVVRLREVHLGD